MFLNLILGNTACFRFLINGAGGANDDDDYGGGGAPCFWWRPEFTF